MGRAFRQVERVIATSGSTGTFTLRNLPLALNGLTIWAVSGGRVLTDLTLQPQVNGVNFGGSVNFTAAVAAGVIYSGGVDEDILPRNEVNATTGLDPFVFTVLVTDAGAGLVGTRTVTLYAVGLTPDL